MTRDWHLVDRRSTASAAAGSVLTAVILFFPGDTLGRAQAYRTIISIFHAELPFALFFTSVALVHVFALLCRDGLARVTALSYVGLAWGVFALLSFLGNPIGLGPAILTPVCLNNAFALHYAVIKQQQQAQQQVTP